MKYIKDKDWENISEMIDFYNDNVMKQRIVAGACSRCENWDLFHCSKKDYYFKECVKIGDGMRYIFLWIL